MKMLLLSAAAALAAAAAAIIHNPAAAPGIPGAGQPLPVTSLVRDKMLQDIQRDFAKIDSNRDGFVTKAEAEDALTMKSTITATIAVGPDQKQQQPAPGGGTMFDQLDTSRDGIVTRAEAEPVFATGRMSMSYTDPGEIVPKRNWEAFVARYDANGDGVITRAEFDADFPVPRNIGSLASKLVLRKNIFVGRRFDTADLNQDGRLSLEEATNAALARFDSADSNGDGTLSPDELRNRLQEMMKHLPGY